MFWWTLFSQRATRCVILVFTALCFAVPFIILSSGAPGTFRSWFLDALRSIRQDGSPTAEPATPFFEWENIPSEFEPLVFQNAQEMSVKELCQAFPSDVLDRIQPVLKTGYAVMHERLPAQFQSTLACLGDIPIFSDLEGTFEGHQVHDVIADIPSHLPHAGKKHIDQFVDYYALQAFAANHTLESADLTALNGWKTDKFKFLAGVSRAFMMRPNRDWYVFFEDDTYIAWDNLFRMLGHFNPDAPWYFGSPVAGHLGPDGKHTRFAYGGTGYVLSRAAMRRLVRDDWNWDTGEYLGTMLTVRWWESQVLPDCCGDSILGWALWNEDVQLSALFPMFSGAPPRRIDFTEKYWCKPVLTMHKSTAEEMIGMWRWEWEERRAERPLLYRDLATTFFDFTNLTSRSDWDNASGDSYRAPTHSPLYSHNPHTSFSACQQACKALPACMQFSYHLHICKLDKSFRFGEARDPELGKVGKDLNLKESKMQWSEKQMRFEAGWMKERIAEWMDQRRCEKIEWLRPNSGRSSS